MYEEDVETEDGDVEEKITNQATKRDDFLKKIETCSSILGVSLRLPLDNDMYTKLQDMFTHRRLICAEIMQRHLDDAKTMGNDYIEDLRQEPVI
jgi:hypothetical protein